MIIRLWEKIHDHYKGDPGRLTLFTMVMLILSDSPIYGFTLLDILKLPSLYKYRLHYAREVSSHLGARVYPPLRVIKEALKDAEFNFIFAYVIPGYLAIKLANKLGIFVYDTKREVSVKRLVKETVLISLLADLMFYGIHRTVHTPRFYQTFHKKHHEFRYSMALTHHYMEFHEALAFALPQALPPLLLIPFFGRMHILSMWCGMFFTQTGAILGHAGYNFFKLPDWVPFFKAAFHDFHHVDYSVNFGANFEFTDMLFGTFMRAPIASTEEAVKILTNDKPYDYVRQAISRT